jgi:hypothetical protein
MISGTLITVGGSAFNLADYIPGGFKQIDILAGAGNGGSVYIGDSTVAADKAFAVLPPGKAWGTKSQSGESVVMGDLYVHGDNAGDYVHVIYVQ